MDPANLTLRERFGRLTEEELQRALPRLNGLSETDREVLVAMSRSLVNKLLHQPLTELKAGAAGPDGGLLIDAVRRLFDLEEELENEALEKTRAAPTLTPAAATGPTGEPK